MRYVRSTLLAITLATSASAASAADPQAEAFFRIYTGACVQYIGDLSVLREKLRAAPQLPTDKAGLFLRGSPGIAYPVPDKNGTFVVALPADKHMCALFARRVDAAAVEESFLKLARNAPRPYVARLVSEEPGTSSVNGRTKTIMYEWAAEGALRKIVLTLTTATSEQAEFQGLASVALSQ